MLRVGVGWVNNCMYGAGWVTVGIELCRLGVQLFRVGVWFCRMGAGWV